MKNDLKYLKTFESSGVYYLVIKSQKDSSEWTNSVDLFTDPETAKNYVLNNINDEILETDNDSFEEDELTNAGAFEDKENDSYVFISYDKAIDFYNIHFNWSKYEIQEVSIDHRRIDVDDTVKKIRTENRFDL